MNADGRAVAKRLGSDASIDGTSQTAGSEDANYTGSQNTGTTTTGVTVNSTGSSGTNANMPPYMGIQFIIKT
jgi:microcystin-dependent protein